MTTERTALEELVAAQKASDKITAEWRKATKWKDEDAARAVPIAERLDAAWASARAALAQPPAQAEPPMCKMAAFSGLPCVVELCTGSCFREQNDTVAQPAQTNLRAALESARLALHEIAEEWAGAECGEPVHAQEAYAIGLAKRMYGIAASALRPNVPVKPA